jgi:uridylate kinase
MESKEREQEKYSGTIAISLGGSILSKKEGYNVRYASEFCELIKRHRNEKFAICVGGGKITREIVSSVSSKIENKALLDELGIAITRLNALVLKDLMYAAGVDVNEVIPTTLEQFKGMHSLHRVTVFGGLMEGITTDADAMLAAELTSSRLTINIGETPYIYDRNPKEKGARKLEKLSHEDLLLLARAGDNRAPSTNFIFDYVATLLAKRSGIRLLFVGEEIKDLEAALAGRPHNGSTVEG